MKTFTIEVYPYPKEYDIVAENSEEAREKARELFHNDTDGAGIYETNAYEVN